MANKLYDEASISAIGPALRQQNGSTKQYNVSEMASAVLDLPVSPIVDKDALNTVQFPQMNAVISQYMSTVNYASVSDDYSITEILHYYNTSTSYSKEDPAGLNLKVPENTTIDITQGSKQRSGTFSGDTIIYNLEPKVPATVTFKDTTYKVIPEDGVRMIYVPSVWNMRDLGGWKCKNGSIKYGKFFRGGNLGSITEEDKSTLCDWLGINLVVDLRNNTETGGITVSPLGNNVEYFHNSIEYYANAIATEDTSSLTVTALKKIMSAIVEGKTVYCHCFSGADRTGTIAYILESLLGISPSDKDKEYELTGFSDEVDGRRFRNFNYDLTNGNGLWALIKKFRDTYAGEDDNAKVYAWALANGITADEIEAFRDAIIEKTEVQAEVSYTNVLPQALTPSTLEGIWDGKGYRNGVCASSASPYYGTDATCWCTGCIAIIPTDTIYVKGAVLEGSGHNRLGAYASTGSCYFCKQFDQMTGLATITKLDENYYKINLVQTSDAPNYAYIMFSAQGTGEGVIVTRNEEIVSGTEDAKEFIQHADISDDIKTKVLDIVQKVQAKRQNDSIVFVAGSDAHQLESNMNIVSGNLHAGQAMKCLSYALPGIDFCCYLGDYTWGDTTTTLAEGQRHFKAINADIDEAFQGIPQFRTLGNRDSLQHSKTQNGSVLSASDLYKLCGIYNEGADNINKVSGYCYRDFYDKKCRVICLNTAENSEKEFVTQAQKLWFAEALKNVGSRTGWSVIILSHHPLDWGNVCELSNIVDAYYEGTSINIGAEAYNFSGTNNAKILIAAHGHVHCFKTAKLNKVVSNVGTEYNVWRMAVPNMCFSRNNEYGKNDATEYYGIEFGETTTYNKTANSINDTSFVVNVVNPSENKIYSFCFGAGYDREIFIGETIIPVTGLELNETSGELSAGSTKTLIATVIPSTATNKTVLWSSNNPAVATVSQGVITTKAAGNATITARTEDGGFEKTYSLTVIAPVIDLFTTNGYAENTRLSTSSGAEKTDSSATGYITLGHTTPIAVDKNTYPNGAVIRVTGAVNCLGNNWSGTDNGAYSAWVMYVGNGTTFNSSSYIETKTTHAVGSIVVDADKKGFTLTLASLGAPKYLKFCVKGSREGMTATLTPAEAP